MRKICIFLCLSLFTSLIHAAVMKTDLPSLSQTHPVSTPDHSAHHCDEEVSKPSDSTPKHTCHGNSPQCCLGLIVIPSLGLKLRAGLTETLNSTYSHLVLRTRVNLIYRPPKS